MLEQGMDVDAQGAVWNERNWNTYLNDDQLSSDVKSALGWIRQSTELRDRKPWLLRRHAKEAFQQSTLTGVVTSIVWGYPKGKFPGGRGFAKIFAEAGRIAKCVDQLKSKTCSAGDVCCSFSAFPGLGPSTFTKIAYFAEIETDKGACLIYDQMVMRAISESEIDHLRELRKVLGSCRKQIGYKNYSHTVQCRTYGDYLFAVGEISKATGKRPELIELELFDAAPRSRRSPFQK
jgi:hypothetical protein